jgi:hypothetical protein
MFKMCCGPRLKAVKEDNSRDIILNERLNSEEYEKYDRPQPHLFQNQMQENKTEKKQEQCIIY